MRLVKNIGGILENIELAESIITLAELLNHDVNSFSDSDVKQNYMSAVDEIRIQNFDTALTKFIDTIRTDRNYDDDGSRKVCIAIFEYLGEKHEITQKHRCNFGSALYV